MHLAIANAAQEERSRMLAGEWFAYLERERWDSEDLLCTSRRVLMLRALEDCNGSMHKAETMLGLKPRTIGYWIKKWGMCNEYKPQVARP